MTTPLDISRQTGIPLRTVQYHCRRLWTERNGHFKLNEQQVVQLLERIRQCGRKNRRELLRFVDSLNDPE